jgi:hypothetical protein
LDWVADLENPTSYVVDGYKAIDRALSRLVLPGVGLSVLGTFWLGAWAHGFASVYIVFGIEDASRIFQQAARRHGRLQAYSFIPIGLISSRTNYADFVLPTGTLFLLVTQLIDNYGIDGYGIDMTVWPPRASTVFAILPSVRGAYNWCYNRAFGELSTKWLKEIQPRQDEETEDQERNLAHVVEEGDLEDGDVLLEVEIGAGGADGQQEDQGNADNQNPGAADGQHNHEHGEAHRLLGHRGGRIMADTSSLGQSIMGALAFPSVAAGMGGLLSYMLPTSWLDSSNIVGGRPGLLRTRWGRSVIGGCLFVVLKDALVLYCRWRLAQTHRQRRILDFDKKTKQYMV